MSTKYVPIDDVAATLHVSLATVRSWVRRGHIPTHTYIKVGNTYRFDIEAVLSSLRGSVAETVAVVEPLEPMAPAVEEVDTNLDNDI